jgi:type III pantothenate kinase
VLIASVTDQHPLVLDFLSPRFSTHLFTAQTKLPLRNLYKSALTLGSDRIAASVGGYHFYPNKNVLTVDAGTCIKYNFVSDQNEYIGGAISPGIPMRLKAMHEFTSKLPAVAVDKSYTTLIGQSTQASLLSGALIAAVCEVDGMIARYLELYPDLIVLVTGGDGDYLCSQLKSRFFANQNLLLYGLNTILHYHLEN